MFLKTVKRQGEEIFRLEKINKQLEIDIDELETEKEQLKAYFNNAVDDISVILSKIQVINRMNISQYEKSKRINSLIYFLNEMLLNTKIN